MKVNDDEDLLAAPSKQGGKHNKSAKHAKKYDSKFKSGGSGGKG